jgi:hypothetical protein
MVFARHLDNFNVTRQILPTYQDRAIRTDLHDTKPSSIYRDWQKTLHRDAVGT